MVLSTPSQKAGFGSARKEGGEIIELTDSDDARSFDSRVEDAAHAHVA